MIVKNGVAIMLLTKKWADLHGLTMKEKVSNYILGTNEESVQILGMTSMSILLVSTL